MYLKMDFNAALMSLLLIIWITNDVLAQNYKACGFPPEYYSPSSQDCKNGTVIQLTNFADVLAHNYKACGFPPEYYNPSSQDCKNGTVIQLTNLPTDLPCSSDDILFCDTQIYCGAREGFKCCGFNRYHPDFETCCRQTSAKYMIHTDKPEKEYVCCDFETYKRGSKDVPCNHPSLNDRLFQKPLKLEKMKIRQDTCLENNIIIVDIIAHNRSRENPEMWARITSWRWDTTDRRLGQLLEDVEMLLPLDRYSPGKKNLVGRKFLVFSSHPYHEDMVFFLNPHDSVYKSPRKPKQLPKLLTKLENRCYRLMKNNSKRG